MGIYVNSPWGTVSKTIGDAVGARSRGQNVVRSKPSSYNDANTLVQRQNRAKQKIKAKSLQMIQGFIRLYITSLVSGATAFSKAMQQFLHSAITFTGAVSTDTVDSLIPKSVIDGSALIFGDGSCDSPVLDGTATWDGVNDEISQTLVDISARPGVPSDSTYKCFMINKNDIGAFVSTSELVNTTTAAVFEFDASIPAGDYLVFIGLSNSDKSSLTAYAGTITVA